MSQAAPTEPAAGLLLNIVRGLVDNPDYVLVRPSRSGNETVYNLRVAPMDIGKVVGRGGRNVTALRVVARAAHTAGDRVSVEIDD